MLSRDLERYIDGKRSLGFKFRSQSVQLRSFVAFAESRGDRYVRSARVIAWAGKATSPQHRHYRLLLVRRFALALHADNARHQVPGTAAFGRVTIKRRTPYIYAPGEITRLLQASSALDPASTIRPIMYTTLLGLISATGMRIAEALALRLEDVTADGLVIRETKFHKNRLLPLHATVQQALDRYLVARRDVLGGSTLFVSDAGRPLPYTSVRYVFLTLLDRTGLRGADAGRDPRIHDLRHTFAVRSLEACSHDRTAVARHIVALSTYLGHAHVSDTYWYLQATPALMGQIAEAGETLLAGGAA